MCGIHDLLRELCLRVAKKEKFFQDMRVLEIPQGIDRERRIVLHGKEYHHVVYDALESALLARSLICDGGPLLCIFPLLRVLTNVYSGSLEDIVEQVNLRYLSYKCYWGFNPGELSYKLTSSISLLWNVQTLIIKAGKQIEAPSEIWEMQQLRHLEFDKIYIPDPPPSDQQEDDFLLQNLQTLANVVNFRLSEDVCKRIPNIKKLHITYDDFSGECQTNYYRLNNLGHLHILQSLSCFFYQEPKRGDLLQNLVFPSSLRELSLGNCRLYWEDLTRIGFSLPYLEVLKLEWDSVVGPKWDPVEGAFPCLIKTGYLLVTFFIFTFPYLKQLFSFCIKYLRGNRNVFVVDDLI